MGIKEFDDNYDEMEENYFPISGDEVYYDGIEEIESDEDYFTTDEYGEEE